MLVAAAAAVMAFIAWWFQLGGSVRVYADRPDGGPDWDLRFDLVFLFPRWPQHALLCAVWPKLQGGLMIKPTIHGLPAKLRIMLIAVAVGSGPSQLALAAETFPDPL